MFGNIPYNVCKDLSYYRTNLMQCLRKLNETHYIMHAHGNNFASCKNGIPNVLELTYVNKKCIPNVPSKNKTLLPIKGLDYPNFYKNNDILLDKWPFVSNS